MGPVRSRAPALAVLVRGSAPLTVAAVRLGGAARHAPTGDVTQAPPASFAPTTVTLLTHDSFAVSKAVLAAFRERTGITVKVVTGGDAGEVVNKAVLTAGNPEGDVLFGVDNTLLSRAVDAGIFAPYRPAALSRRATRRCARWSPRDAVVPVDYGDVCVNVDDAWFAAHRASPAPTSLADLDRRRVQGPAGRREPGDLVARARLPARDHRAVRHRRLAGVLASAARQRRQGRRRLDQRVRRRLHRRRRQGHPPARRQLRHRARRPSIVYAATPSRPRRPSA